MIPKSGYRFSEKIMLQQKAEEECHIGRVSDRAADKGIGSITRGVKRGARPEKNATPAAAEGAAAGDPVAGS
jgi:hypothetical protein